MKTSISILLSILSLSVFSQIPENKLDTTTNYLFEAINEVRKEHGLNTLSLNIGIVNACKHHATYISVYYPTYKQSASHHETLNDSAHLIKALLFPSNRLVEFGVLNRWIAENVVVTNVHRILVLDDILDSFMKMSNINKITDINYLIENSNNLTKSMLVENNNWKYTDINNLAAARLLISNWMLSPSHRREILSTEGKAGGAYQYLYIDVNNNPQLVGVYIVTSR